MVKLLQSQDFATSNWLKTVIEHLFQDTSQARMYMCTHTWENI